METTTEVQELSLEKVIETKLIQANVTEQVLAALKDKYGKMKLKALDDKESYLELKVAARDCAKVRTLTVKLCKEGRERAVKEQKLWIAKEKEIVGEVDVVESALDAEIAKYDNEVKRKEQDEIKRQEETYINRQAALNKMGATYSAGNFILGDASFEGDLIKGMPDDVWEETVLPKFQVEYEKIEAVRIVEEKIKAEKEAAIKADQEKLRQEQEAFRLQQEQFKQQQEESARVEKERNDAQNKAIYNSRVAKLQEMGLVWNFSKGVFEGFGVVYENDFVVNAEQSVFDSNVENAKPLILDRKLQIEKDAEAKRIADIEFQKSEAIRLERERISEEQKQAEIKKKQEEEKRQAELEAAGDKTKWEDFISQVKSIRTIEMRSGQYRKKMAIAKEKIDEILAL